MKKFPACFPEDFVENILPAGALEQDILVYRVCKSGILDSNSFLSTFEEVILGLEPKRKDFEKSLKKPGTYSTSCFYNIVDAQFWLDFFTKKHPRAIIIKGSTNPNCGPSQKTHEREPKRTDSHVDWWVYEKVEPDFNIL